MPDDRIEWTQPKLSPPKKPKIHPALIQNHRAAVAIAILSDEDRSKCVYTENT